MDEFGRAPRRRAPGAKIDPEEDDAIDPIKKKKGNDCKDIRKHVRELSATKLEEKGTESSLHLLASRFIDFMESRPSKSADIPSICEALDIPKRRIYDVTNVLEGVGLVIRHGKNGYKWIGWKEEEKAVDPAEDESRMLSLKHEIRDLDCESLLLDKAIAELSGQICGMLRDPDVSNYAFLYRDELVGVAEMRDSMLLAIQCPLDTYVSITPAETVSGDSGQGRCEVVFTSEQQEIKAIPIRGVSGAAAAQVVETAGDDGDYDGTVPTDTYPDTKTPGRRSRARGTEPTRFAAFQHMGYGENDDSFGYEDADDGIFYGLGDGQGSDDRSDASSPQEFRGEHLMGGYGFWQDEVTSTVATELASPFIMDAHDEDATPYSSRKGRSSVTQTMRSTPGADSAASRNKRSRKIAEIDTDTPSTIKIRRNASQSRLSPVEDPEQSTVVTVVTRSGRQAKKRV